MALLRNCAVLLGKVRNFTLHFSFNSELMDAQEEIVSILEEYIYNGLQAYELV